MLEALAPRNDDERVAALRALNILDTASEERFDRLTRLATRLFDVPIALVSLIDHNRQWFKSVQGLSVTETPRNISFCGHVVFCHETLVIKDASRDARFADNPLVTGPPHIRFYAGYPLKDIDGFVMGTLCIIDSAPRPFSSEDLQNLTDLGQMAERELNAIQLATHDTLTGLSNRRGLEVLAEKALKYCVRHNAPTSLAFIDLNKFKAINDQHGHAAGDNVLKTFSAMMLERFRDSDICARLGGDEFVILMLDATEQQAAQAIENFREAIAEAGDKGMWPCPITFSSGVVLYNPFRHASLHQLLQESDKLMYQQKETS